MGRGIPMDIPHPHFGGRPGRPRSPGAHLSAHFAQLLPLGFGKSGALSDGCLGATHCFSGVAGGCAETWGDGEEDGQG